MRQIIKALNNIKGNKVNIYTNHKIFGGQHIEMKFDPETTIGLGFHYKDQVIYVSYDEIVDYIIEDNKIIINGNMMSISVIKID